MKAKAPVILKAHCTPRSAVVTTRHKTFNVPYTRFEGKHGFAAPVNRGAIDPSRITRHVPLATVLPANFKLKTA